MGVLIAHNLFALTARTVSVVMMPLAFAKLVGREALAATRHANLTAHPMEESATMETACVPLVSLVFSARQRLTFAPTSVSEMEFAMSGPSNATAKRDSLDLTAQCRAVPRAAMSPMASAMLESATVHLTSPEMIARKRNAQTAALEMEFVTQRSALATAILAGRVMTAASRHALVS